MQGYSAKIVDTSREISAKEKIQLKDTTGAIKLDEVLEQGPLTIKPDMYAVLAIHNEKSDNVDYENYLVKDVDGNTYVTGSESFFSSFRDIFDDMLGEDEEWAIKIYKMDSKNYKGKQFITCSIV